jgi:hypothetical protein
MVGWLLNHELGGRATKRRLSNLSCCAVICLEGLRKTTNVRLDSWSPDPNSEVDPLEYAADEVLVLYPSGTVIVIEFMSQQNHVY